MLPFSWKHEVSISLPEPSQSGTHLLAVPECLKRLLINLGSRLAQLNHLLQERGRHYHDALPIAHEDLARVDPQVVLELQRDIDFRGPRECIGTQDGSVACKDLFCQQGISTCQEFFSPPKSNNVKNIPETPCP